ncbi:MAG: hypothetical protein ACXWTY_16810 [Methylobacter sp.]
MNRPGDKIDTDHYLIKSDVARRMDVPLWRLNQIIKSLGGFPPETFVTDPYTHSEIRVYERAAAERWIEKWREREFKKKIAGIDPGMARAFITRA